MVTVEIFWKLGHKITRHDLDGSISVGYRKFRAFFGTSPIVCVVTWDLMFNHHPRNSKPEHLLWALMLLKRYHVENVNAILAGANEKTFRKWSFIFIRLLSKLPMVNRKVLRNDSFIPNFWLNYISARLGKTFS